MSSLNANHILVFGATGAQGLAVINGLLAPRDDGTPSPYTVRAFTRDVNSSRAKQLTARGVECVQGNTDDEASILAALKGIDGVWANIDSFTVGQQKEIYTGIKLFELSKQVRTVRHFIWSSLDYAFKKGDYNPKYYCDHENGKGKVADWMKSQPSNPTADDLSWSIVTTCAYMEMLNFDMFGPINRRDDGTFVFAAPIDDSEVPMITLSDLGSFARYTFDHRRETSGKELEVASDMVGWDYLVSTFTKVTGQKAVFLRQNIDEWMDNLNHVDLPLASDRWGQEPDGSITWRQNFTAWWAGYHDGLVKRDLKWLRSIHPKLHTLESWMRETKYDGIKKGDVLKNQEDGKAVTPKLERVKNL
ncbi:NmrA-like oxidoreductase [Abortiporus biennis]